MPENDDTRLTLARIKYGLAELEDGAGQAIPEPIRVMLGALARWRVGVLEADLNADALGERDADPPGDVIIDVQSREVR